MNAQSGLPVLVLASCFLLLASCFQLFLSTVDRHAIVAIYSTCTVSVSSLAYSHRAPPAWTKMAGNTSLLSSPLSPPGRVIADGRRHSSLMSVRYPSNSGPTRRCFLCFAFGLDPFNANLRHRSSYRNPYWILVLRQLRMHLRESTLATDRLPYGIVVANHTCRCCK
jgi:hypothetical protein